MTQKIKKGGVFQSITVKPPLNLTLKELHSAFNGKISRYLAVQFTRLRTRDEEGSRGLIPYLE